MESLMDSLPIAIAQGWIGSACYHAIDTIHTVLL